MRGDGSPTFRPRYPGQALAVALYEVAGIRGCEIGTVMFGRHPDGTETSRRHGPCPAGHAAPRVYPVACRLHRGGFREVAAMLKSLKGYRIAWEPPMMRHFTAKFAPL
jgi:tryptophanase